MLSRIVGFELRYQLRQPLFWVTAAVFFALAFVVTVTDALQIGGGIGSLQRNAPYVVVRILGDMSVLGAFMIVAFVATSVLRDFERGTAEVVFSRPVRVRDLLLGRFLGSVGAACFCFTFAAMGLLAGSRMPWLDPERVAPLDLRPHLFGLGVLAFPSFVIMGALFFALASRVRNMFGVYVALVGLLLAYFVGGAMFGDLEGRAPAALLDPFGTTAFALQTRYWTVAEKNARVPALAGTMLWNRLLWLGLGAAALALAIGRFRYEQAGRRGRRRGAGAEAPAEAAPSRVRQRPSFTSRTPWSQLASQFRLEARSTLRSVPFLLILSFGLVNVIANMGYLEQMFGTPVWPVTHLMLLAIHAGYSFLLIVILAFYAGEAVWRERGLRLDGILDSTPVSLWVPLAAKLLALWAAAAVFIAAGMLGLMGFQLASGHRRLEPLLYAQGFVVEMVPFLLIAVLAIALQVLVNQKFLGYLLMVLYLVSNGVLRALHFDHPLYRYAGVPSASYSDMNGWGHFVAPQLWFGLYWSFGAGLLLVAAYLAWVRGSDAAWRPRWLRARGRWRGAVRWAAAGLASGFAATGGFIFYNTNVRNEYVPSDEALRRRADYEAHYGRYRGLTQPRIVAAKVDVDLYPEERRADIRGTYRLVNRSDAPIPALHVNVPRGLRVDAMRLPPHRTLQDDRRLGHAIYELESPLAPGSEMELGFDLAIVNPGFTAGTPDSAVVANGSFFHSRGAFPALGYQKYAEIKDPAERRRRGLPPVVRMAKLDDLEARSRYDLATDSEWIAFETTVSTAADQVALAPGELQREWTQGGRRHFHYRMETPIPKFFSYLSARYAVRRDSWQDVALEVFHHPGHEYNVGRMLDAMKKTLAYMSRNFSPYQHRRLVIAEVPRYGRFAASFPGLIPFSESIGFIARLERPDAIDYPFYVTAHEVAHQWWGYQVMGGDVQGQTMLSETMAQYSALMVMEREYGAHAMRRFLRHELDGYLSGRGGELLEELPLELVEDQPYIHYRKGALALYAMKDAIGEARLNQALKRYITAVRFQKPPYTVSRELLSYVAEATPADRQGLLADMFGSITLFDNQAIANASRALPDGRHEVTVKARLRKLKADGKGVETEVPVDDWIDIGVFAAPAPGRQGEERPLYLEKHHVTGSDVTVQVVVSGTPDSAGIDPYNKLIDRTPGDNMRAVERR